MLTIALGLSSSLCYALGDFFMVKVVRQAAVLTALAWAMTVGLLILLPLALLTEGLPRGSTEWLAVGFAVASGLCELGGLACVFRGLVTGNLSVVAPLASLGGGLAALIMIVRGESLPALALIGLVLAVAAGLLASIERAPKEESDEAARAGAPARRARTTAGAGWALLAAVLFAAGMLLFAEAPALGPIALAAYGRLGGVIILVPTALVVAGLRLPRPMAIRAGLAGVVDAGALVLIATALRIGPVAVATVFSSQIGTMAVLLGIVVLRERLSRVNLAGIILACVATTLIATAG
jgi:drug/metabolite transporter (DMT)-like permease